MKDGILIIDKPEGPTSHDVVEKVKRALKAKKVGHLGTLDPFATGVLPLVVDRATKLASLFSSHAKAYEFDLILGAQTETDDEHGKVVRTGTISENFMSLVSDALRSFKGEGMQVPPSFSAVKIDGKPLYKRALKGEKIDVPPRPVTIHELKFIDDKKLASCPPDSLCRIRLFMECTSGTFVRAVCRDIGVKIGSFGHAGRIRRVRSGPFNIDDAIPLDEFLVLPIKAQNGLILSPDDPKWPFKHISFDKALKSC